MGKIDFRRLSKRELTALNQELWGTLERCRTKKELLTFLRHLITGSEYVMLARRIQIAKMLMVGYGHMAICAKLGVGQATVQSVDRWLRRSFEDYRKLLPPLLHEAREKRQSGLPVPDALEPLAAALRKLHPFHYALIEAMIQRWGDIEEAPLQGRKKVRA